MAWGAQPGGMKELRCPTFDGKKSERWAQVRRQLRTWSPGAVPPARQGHVFLSQLTDEAERASGSRHLKADRLMYNGGLQEVVAALDRIHAATRRPSQGLRAVRDEDLGVLGQSEGDGHRERPADRRLHDLKEDGPRPERALDAHHVNFGQLRRRAGDQRGGTRPPRSYWPSPPEAKPSLEAYREKLEEINFPPVRTRPVFRTLCFGSDGVVVARVEAEIPVSFEDCFSGAQTQGYLQASVAPGTGPVQAASRGVGLCFLFSRSCDPGHGRAEHGGALRSVSDRDLDG